MTTEIYERMNFSSGAMASGILSGVAILRSVSLNGRTYSPRALQDCAKLINGAKAFIDHPTKSESRDSDGVRSVKDILGYFTGGRVDGSCVKASLHVLENHREWLSNLVAQMSDKIGLSIHAVGDIINDGGQKVVETITALHSADLVTAPASTVSMFESKGPDMRFRTPDDPVAIWADMRQGIIDREEAQRRLKAAKTFSDIATPHFGGHMQKKDELPIEEAAILRLLPRKENAELDARILEALTPDEEGEKALVEALRRS